MFWKTIRFVGNITTYCCSHKATLIKMLVNLPFSHYTCDIKSISPSLSHFSFSLLSSHSSFFGLFKKKRTCIVLRSLKKKKEKIYLPTKLTICMALGTILDHFHVQKESSFLWKRILCRGTNKHEMLTERYDIVIYTRLEGFVKNHICIERTFTRKERSSMWSKYFLNEAPFLKLNEKLFSINVHVKVSYRR